MKNEQIMEIKKYSSTNSDKFNKKKKIQPGKGSGVADGVQPLWMKWSGEASLRV